MRFVPFKIKDFCKPSRQEILLIALLLALIVSLICFPYLWLARLGIENFPNLGWVEPVAPLLHLILYLTMMGALIAVLVVPARRRFFLTLAIGLWLFTSALDIARFQPQFFLSFIWLGLLIFPKRNETEHTENALNPLRFTLVGFYFWAGFFKLNDGFVKDIFPWFMSGLGFSSLGNIKTLAWAAAGLETSCAILLLFNRSRKLATFFLISMHLAILKVFGPFGYNYHLSLIVMNVFHIVFLLFLVLDPWPEPRKISVPRFKVDFLAWILIWILPFFSLFNLYNDLLSFRIYSGSTIQANILSQGPISRMSIPKKADALFSHSFATPISMWSIDSLGYAFLSKTYFEKLFLKVCKNHNDDSLSPKLIINNSLRYPILGLRFVIDEKGDQVIDCE